MRHFCDHTALWLDLIDPYRHFSLLVPRLASNDTGLRNAIFAVAARDLSMKPNAWIPNFQPTLGMAAQYYHETLQYLQHAMHNEDYLHSDELLATVHLISTYELMEGDGQAWERHLRGAVGVHRSLDIHGECGGFRQAVWWAWLRQDLWAAFRERRKVFSSYRPVKPYSALNEWGLADRAVYLCTRAINFASIEELQAGMIDPAARLQHAEELEAELDSWACHLTPHFQPLASSMQGVEGPFKPLWIHPPAFGTFRCCTDVVWLETNQNHCL